MKRTKLSKIAAVIAAGAACAAMGFAAIACGDDDPKGPDPKPSGHDHVWATEWTPNETHHWHICTVDGCEEVNGKAEHVDLLGEDGEAGPDGYCDVCGYEVGEHGGEDIAVTSVTLNKTTANIYLADKEELVATVLPANATDKTVTYESSNPTVVSVSANGEITALQLGTATITAKAGEQTATCTVTVASRTYYVRGSMNGWTDAATSDYQFVQSNDDPYIYTLNEIVIQKEDAFKIDDVDESWGHFLAYEDLDTTNTDQYFGAQNADGGSNFLCKVSAKYKITINLHNAKRVSIEWIENVAVNNITAASDFAIWGSAATDDLWTAPTQIASFTHDEETGEWTAVLENIHLRGGNRGFQPRCVLNNDPTNNTKYLDGRINYTDNVLDNFAEVDGLESKIGNGNEEHFVSSEEGTYTFTLVLNADGSVKSLTAVKTA